MKVNREMEEIEAQLGQEDEDRIWEIGAKERLCVKISL